MADAETFVPAQTMLTCYYSVNDEYMMSKFQLLSKENIDKIRHIPCVAVQGAKDLICPPDSALDLSQSWPEMECIIVTDGKHSMYDPLISSELIKATDRLAEGAKIQ
jgi:proline iminopeptidase